MLLTTLWLWYLSALAARPLLVKALSSGCLAAISDAIAQRLLGARRLSRRRCLLLACFGLVWYGEALLHLVGRWWPQTSAGYARCLRSKALGACLLACLHLARSRSPPACLHHPTVSVANPPTTAGPSNHAWQAVLTRLFPPPATRSALHATWRLLQRVGLDQLVYAPVNNCLMILCVGGWRIAGRRVAGTAVSCCCAARVGPSLTASQAAPPLPRIYGCELLLCCLDWPITNSIRSWSLSHPLAVQLRGVSGRPAGVCCRARKGCGGAARGAGAGLARVAADPAGQPELDTVGGAGGGLV